MSATRVDGMLEVRLRPSGFGRFFGGGFLLIWLCGWAVGEVVVLGVLIWGGYGFVAGTQPNPGPTLAMGAFLLFWLTFWTIGGVAAMRQLVRTVWAEDRLAVAPGALRVTWQRGPFRRAAELRRDEIHALRVKSAGKALVAETAERTIELSSLGSAAERESAAAALVRELGIASRTADDGPVVAPQGWTEIVDAEGRVAFVRDPALREKQALVVGVVAAALAALAVYLVGTASANPSIWPLALMTGAAAAGASWGALWLARGRMEWRAEGGRLVLRRRFGARVRDVFDADALELTVSADSDGDDWYELRAVAPGAPEATEAFPPSPARRETGRRRVACVIHDPEGPRQLGRWLAARSGVRLHDRSTRQERTADLAQLKLRLEASGRVGRFVARLVERAEDARRRPGGGGA